MTHEHGGIENGCGFHGAADGQCDDQEQAVARKLATGAVASPPFPGQEGTV